MKRSLLLLAATILFAIPVHAQNLSLARETKLHERPDAASTVKMTLPAGMELQVLSEQGEWRAVSTTTGIVGWIHQSANEAGEDTDDLIKSISDLNEQQAVDPAATGAAAAVPAGAAPTPSGNTNPPPPPPSGAPAGAAGAGAAVGAAAATAPPPPPARPPGQSGQGAAPTSFGAPPPSSPPMTSFIAGIYDKFQWISAAFEMRDEFKKLDLQYNKILGKITQLGGWFTGTDGFFLPNFETDFLDDFFEPAYGATAKFARGDSCPCGADVQAFEGGLRLNFYPMASSRSPFGMYLGGVIGYGGLSGEDKPEGVSGVATLGGEGGIFYRIGSANSPQFIPRAQVQIARKEFICDSESFACGFDEETGDSNSTIGDTGTQIQLGLDVNYHGIVPGVHLTLVEVGVEETKFESIFGFSLTYAY